MPLSTAESTILKNAPGARFTERTAVGDWAWAQQVMALGFGPLTEMAPGVSWAVAAAGHDRQDGRIALHLVNALLNLMEQSHPPLLPAVTQEVALCISRALDTGNVPLLTGLASRFDALPPRVRDPLVVSLCGHAQVDHHPSGRPLLSLVGHEALHRARRDPRMDRAPGTWAWVKHLVPPEDWRDSSPRGLRAAIGRKLCHSLHQDTSVQRTLAFLDSVSVGPSLDGNPDLLDVAMSVVRRKGLPVTWNKPGLPLSEAQVDHDALHMALTVIDWAVHATPPPPPITLDGRNLLAEASSWLDGLDRAPALGWAAPRLHATLIAWEKALLYQAAEPDPSARVQRAQARVRL